MWSLAIEEQFYLVFPLLAVGVLALLRGRRAGFAIVLAVGALGSWGLALERLSAGTPFDRVYLGTDTRIGAIFCGAVAGALSVHPPTAARLARAARPLGVPALAAVGALGVVLDGAVAWSAPRWALLPLLEVCVAVVLLAATSVERPAASSRLLGVAPLVWLGGISYGLYLWHIPVVLTAERALRDEPRWMVVTVATAVCVGIAQLSAVVLERPIRRRGLAAAPRFTIVIGSVLVLFASYAVVTDATKPARRLERDRTAGEAEVEVAAIDPTESGPAIDGEAVLPLDRPSDRPPRVLLLGDSLARDIGPSFAAVATERGMAPSQASFVGCGDGGADEDDDLFNDADFVARCDAWRATFPTILQEAQPDVVVLLRASARRTIPGSDVVHDRCEPEWLGWYRDEMAREVRELGAEGSAVAVATRPYNRFGDVIDEQNDREVDCMNAVLREVVDAGPSAVLLPINEWVCPTKDACRRKQDGIVLREDGLHFRSAGGEIAVRWMLDELYGT
ncbi:MAG TPA: acyltransferase family protein, partial [Aquihabitans sp.]|nr:acyltransferase family protein [Aquihabitans sp.]